MTQTPLMDAFFKRKPGLWKEWDDRSFMELENLCRRLERERAELLGREYQLTQSLHKALDDRAGLIKALEVAARELDLLYAHAINTGIHEASIPPHRQIRALLSRMESK